MNYPRVSVIVTTLNSEATLDACLGSISGQTYPEVELIVVDNNSQDETVNVARRYTDKVFIKGPERCAQRNFAVSQATGKYILVIDSDMELTPQVVAECVGQIKGRRAKGVIIPEHSFGEGFWAECKRLERSFYVGVDWIEAARFFERQTFLDVGGYNEELVSGEDWDLSQRVEALGPITRIEAFILHNEGRLKLLRTLRKKFYYAGTFIQYTAIKTTTSSHGKQPTNIVLRRFGLFFAQPKRLFKKPHHGIGMLIMKVGEFGFGALGYLAASLKLKRRESV